MRPSRPRLSGQRSKVYMCIQYQPHPSFPLPPCGRLRSALVFKGVGGTLESLCRENLAPIEPINPSPLLYSDAHSTNANPIASTTMSFIVNVFNSATRLLDAVPELVHDPIQANTILPYALKRKAQEESGLASSAYSSFPDGVPPLWVVLWTERHGTQRPMLDLVVAITNSNISTLPLFIFTPHQAALTTPDFLFPRIARLVDVLKTVIDASRVFAVFAPVQITRLFANLWSWKTGIAAVDTPYYRAVLATVTLDSLASSLADPQSFRRNRLAQMADLEEVAPQFKAFADDSVIYPMTLDQAREEACEYIRERKLWLCEAEPGGDGVRTIVSIVAATRNSGTHAFITKVFTPRQFRQQGHAKHLVAWVSKTLPGSTGIYDSVAFRGRGKCGSCPYVHQGRI
ncbi:hypothetical protein BS47DRAFT_710689 [Hydnum rufescens UP504]|uniref:Uncharacterized protein n=1 Tax=Hydnum rufescens UP504 TaxID=1448309 RepID=A0A9P6B1M7_9AGAM|nr:hypothetical protein BS47DRAFT_710689 [Hydnum rufescens UP504]